MWKDQDIGALQCHEFKEITPDPEYVEGSFMAKRKGVYYFMWSEGEWTGPGYSVAYAMSSSPLGPFKRVGKILQQDDRVARGAGHHSVVNIPGTDQWYIAYHRRPLADVNGPAMPCSPRSAGVHSCICRPCCVRCRSSRPTSQVRPGVCMKFITIIAPG